MDGKIIAKILSNGNVWNFKIFLICPLPKFDKYLQFRNEFPTIWDYAIRYNIAKRSAKA
jgi:hypothetical protein